MGGTSVTFARAAILLVLAGTLGSLATVGPASASPADGLSVTDAAGDVSLGRPDVPAKAPSSGGLDLTEARLYGESGEGFYFQAKIADLKAEQPNMPATGGVLVGTCFKWAEKLYAFRVGYVLTPTPQIFLREFGALAGPCDPTVNSLQYAKSVSPTVIIVDVKENTVTVLLKRTVMADLVKAAPPKAGDALTEFRAWASDNKKDRFDLAPDQGVSAGTLVFSTNTANMDLKAMLDKNVVAALTCAGQPDLPTYAIQAGGKRGVPILLVNPQPSARTVTLQVQTVTGDDWKPAMLPKIEVPAAAGEKTGNLTVNVIVDTPGATKHKQCATLRVTALDPADPTALGQATFNVMAVNPPGPTQKKLYMHTAESAVDACSNVWMNVLENDPDDAKKEILMMECRSTQAVSNAPADVTPDIDVNPSHDLVLNTSAVPGGKAVATLTFRSDGAPTTARIDVIVKSGKFIIEPLGEARVTKAIGASETTFSVDVPITFTRDTVATGDPSRVVDAREGIGLIVRYSPVPADGAVPVPVAGRVFFLPAKSTLELPIWSTIKRNTNDPGAGGSLLSIAPADVLPEFASPGELRLLNFTVLNEGAKPDVAVPSATLSGPAGWTTEIFPSTPIPLGPGERGTFQVGVRPRADAPESENAILDVVVTSQQDATARASLSTRLVATREGGIHGDAAPNAAPVGKDKGLLPGPSLPALLGLVAVLGWGLSRRR
jgi:hypothetical protein